MIIRHEAPSRLHLAGTLSPREATALREALRLDAIPVNVHPTLNMKDLEGADSGSGDTLRAISDEVRTKEPRSLVCLIKPGSAVWSALEGEGLMDRQRSPHIIVTEEYA